MLDPYKLPDRKTVPDHHGAHITLLHPPGADIQGGSVSPLWDSTTAIVSPAGRATCRACPWTGFHDSCLQVSPRTPGQQGTR